VRCPVQSVRDFDAITADLAVWHAYDPAVRAELYTTCLTTPDGMYLVDPILLQKRALDQLIGSSRVAGIIVTNSNHHRAAVQFAQQLAVPIFAHRETFPNDQGSSLRTTPDGEEICEGLHVISIEGAPPGEIVLHYTGYGGMLIVGDALINFEPHGFTFLPAKYCSNQKQMRRSLRKLLDYKAGRMFFAHGMPILTGASERLQHLLDSQSS
jgi:glyoxylase-like metal-dependent hydrolase (beta-lactamase superfamily II)